MKKSFLVLLIITLFLQLQAQRHLDCSGFKTPPHESKINTWWHWMDGNISREGITKDLEAMKEQGVVQATLFNIGLFGAENSPYFYKVGERDFGIKRVNSLTPEWFEMFQWALKEAHRLGIILGAHNCEGFSSSGGPWITPEMSMKQYVWTKTIVNASQAGAIKLKQPVAYYNFYKDVAVVAFKTGNPQNSFQQAAPVVLLNDKKNVGVLYDGCLTSAIEVNKGDKITFSFKEPFTAEKIAMSPHKTFLWENPLDKHSTYSLASSDDGVNYKKIADITINGLNKMVTVPFVKTTARFFQLTLNESNNFDYYKWTTYKIAECELLKADEKTLYADEIEFLPEKCGSGKSGNNAGFYNYPETTSSGQPVKEVIDITSKMNGDGTLNWNPDGGNWIVIRFGYTTTGSTNAPAPDLGTGLECDKMDTVALNLHFNSFPAKLIEKAGSMAGNTFKFMLIDSWEAGYQDWTSAMAREFEKRRGYPIIPFIPVLCGESSGNTDTDEAVLYDLRKTTAELIEENYYKHIAELLHRNKMQLHAEIIYGGANWSSLDILKATQYVDVPMYEFWTSANDKQNVSYYPVKGVELNMPACAAIDYEKPIVGAEAYTGMAHYSEVPSDLKPFGDRAFCAGINKMILHAYIHQPSDKKPGMTMREYGSHFNRNNSTWPFMSGWFNYQARIQYVLQQGRPHQDLLYYTGDQLPQGSFYNASDKLPSGHNLWGYMLNLCNFDVLKNRIKVADGKLVLNGKSTYSVLSLPPNEGINFETLQRIEELVKAGVIIYGPKPQRMLSLNDIENNKPAFAALADKIWGRVDGQTVFSNNYGKGKVYWGKPLAEVLSTENILPDLATGQDDATNLMFIHKKLNDGDDVYFVMNQQNAEINREISFRIAGKTPEIWNAEYGNIVKPAIYAMDKNYTTLPVRLKPYQSLLIVFKKGKPVKYIQSIKRNGDQLFPAGSTSKLQLIPNIVLEDNRFVATSSQADGEFELVDNLQKKYTLKSAKEKEFIISEYSGKITFEPGYQASIPPVEFKTPGWLTDSENPDVKYFSGTASYTLSFNFPVGRIEKADSVLLDLGEFGSIARVKLNGKDLGIVWKQGMTVRVKGQLKASNVLEVSVANPFRNRFIGDFAQYGKVKNLWTSSPIADFLNKDTPLKLSGLKGPVRIIAVGKQIFR